MSVNYGLGRFCGNCFNPLTKYQLKACCVTCQYQLSMGSNHHSWNGGKSVHTEGYIVIRKNNKTMLEHRLIMESHIGRKLLPTEVVHHIDGNKSNNLIENIELIYSQSEHMKTHRKSFTSDTHRECTVCNTIKLREFFYTTNKVSADTHHPHCKECQKLKKRMQYSLNPALFKRRTKERRDKVQDASSCLQSN